MITFDDLVKIGRDAQPDRDGQECGICRAEPGEPCGVECDKRGELAKRSVGELVINLTNEQFEELLAVARERQERDDQTPGSFWAWLAVDEEAMARPSLSDHQRNYRI